MVHDTLRNITDKDLETAFREYANKLNETLSNDATYSGFALDGKSLRGSYDNVKDNKMLHILTAFCVDNQLRNEHKITLTFAQK